MIPYISPETGLPLFREGDSLCTKQGERFPIVNGIPRFVSSQEYTTTFGLQWRIHSRTQLDSATGERLSGERLERCLGQPVASLRGKCVLEAGCGAGRFTELMVEAGALVHSIDLSLAVEANKANIGSRENYSIAQANLLKPPFPEEAFDVVLCLGVLQHLPSPEAGIRALWQRLKPGGLLVIDHYRWTWAMVLKGSHLCRFFLRRMSAEESKKISDRLVALFFPVHWRFRQWRFFHILFSRFSPCIFAFRPGLSKEQHYEWSQLDTYDHLTDPYKHLRTVPQIRHFLETLGGEAIWVDKGGNGVEARCRKPAKGR